MWKRIKTDDGQRFWVRIRESQLLRTYYEISLYKGFKRVRKRDSIRGDIEFIIENLIKNYIENGPDLPDLYYSFKEQFKKWDGIVKIENKKNEGN